MTTKAEELGKRIEQALHEASVGLERAQAELSRHLTRASQAEMVVARALSLPQVIEDSGVVEGKMLLQSIVRRVTISGREGPVEVELV